MKKPSDRPDSRKELRDRVIGLGERSIRKSYYPELQQQLAELERFRALLDQSRDAILLAMIPSWTLMDVNNSVCRQLGFTRQEILGLSMQDLIPADAWEQVNTLLRSQPVNEGDGFTIVTYLRKSGGDNFRVEMTVRTVLLSGSVYAVIVARDTSERERAETALRLSEEKYRGIFENAIGGIFQSTPEGRFLTLNPAYARMHGFESPEEMMTAITDIGSQVFVNPRDRERLSEAVESRGFVTNYEIEQYRKDKSRMWVWENVRAVRNPDGQTICYEGTVEDITERRRLESRLNQTQKMEAIGTLAGGIAHDFNNLLTVLMGYGMLLERELDKDDPLQVYVQQIVASTQKAASLTSSLLAFSRKQVMTLEPVNINSHIAETEKLLKRLITEDIALKTDLAPYDITIMADSTQIDQILLNLVTNGRDAMPDGGSLVIATELIELDSESARGHGLEEPGRYARVSVSDTGIGMDQKTKDQIFDPFFTTKAPDRGTGLGLSTVYGIVKEHQGHIIVYSEPGMGTTFRIYLPVAAGAVEAGKPASEEVKSGRETILVAEDNEDVRALIRTILTAYGYTVIEAVDGEDAIEKFNERHGEIDLLIIDSVMPKKNGREVYNEISKTTSTVKALFTSGYTRDIVLDKGIEEKDFRFIPKPLLPGELLRKVRDVLDEKG